MNRDMAKRWGAGLCAGTMLGLVLPWATAAPAGAAYDGYTTNGWASPVRIEIYEPTIPIPASPQVEVNLSFTRIKGQTGQLASTGSWLWPGDPVGQGLKTFGEQLGLPGALTDGGYPVQVNAQHPGEVLDDRQEPFPGAKMRAQAGERETRAQAGFALAEQVSEGDPSDGQTGGGGGLPGLPSIPGLPALPLPGLGGGGEAESAEGDEASSTGSGLNDLVDGLLSGGLLAGLAGLAGGGGGEGGGAGMPGLPPEIALLIDIGGMSSTTRTTLGDDDVQTVARSALGDISIAGGLITLEGVTTVARTSGDGETAKHSGTARIGGMRIAGQLMAIDEGGVTAAGNAFEIPGLSGNPLKALEQLGITLTLPGVTKEKSDEQASVSAEALRIEIDAAKLKGLLDIIPLGALTDALPAEAAELANLLDTVKNLSPRIAISLGNAHSTTLTVPEFQMPAQTEAPAAEAPDETPAPAPQEPTDTGGAGDVPPAAADSGDVPPADLGAAPGGEVPAMDDNRLTSAGLPPLTTIPGLLMWGGIGLGVLAGTWLRRIGLLVLGGGAACAHGFATGLPDLRKA